VGDFVGIPTTDERSLDRRRSAETETRRLYKTARWQHNRLAVFARDLYRCANCSCIEADTSKLVCDHVEPHRGDVEKFWAGPFQTLCKACHDGEKQKQEVAARAAGDDVAGRPASYRPEWLRPSAIPLTIVCGPPASGKSFYVRQHASPSSISISSWLSYWGNLYRINGIGSAGCTWPCGSATRCWVIYPSASHGLQHG
jgi:hypothetical protein